MPYSSLQKYKLILQHMKYTSIISLSHSCWHIGRVYAVSWIEAPTPGKSQQTGCQIQLEKAPAGHFLGCKSHAPGIMSYWDMGLLVKIPLAVAENIGFGEYFSAYFSLPFPQG